ncbi:MAG: chemotaxis protein CheX [Planctomycetota bacterium]
MSATLDVDTSQMVTDATSQSISEIFETMASEPAKQVSGSCVQDPEWVTESGKDQLTITLSLSGDLQGTIGLCLPAAVACRWTEDISGEAAKEVDQMVIDASGELGNMVVGGAKRRLEGFDLKIGLPNVIFAGREAVAFQSRLSPICMKFEYAGHQFDVFVALAPA